MQYLSKNAHILMYKLIIHLKLLLLLYFFLLLDFVLTTYKAMFMQS